MPQGAALGRGPGQGLVHLLPGLCDTPRSRSPACSPGSSPTMCPLSCSSQGSGWGRGDQQAPHCLTLILPARSPGELGCSSARQPVLQCIPEPGFLGLRHSVAAPCAGRSPTHGIPPLRPSKGCVDIGLRPGPKRACGELRRKTGPEVNLYLVALVLCPVPAHSRCSVKDAEQGQSQVMSVLQPMSHSHSTNVC